MGQQILSLDIGGQGVKLATFEIRDRRPHRISEPERWRPRSWQCFEEELSRKHVVKGAVIGIACAGFVDSLGGVVVHSHATGWKNYPVAEKLRSYGALRVSVLNDAEAHLLAHRDEPLPLLCISLGTSIGVAAADDSGRFIKPRRRSNLDLGEMLLRTSSFRTKAWDGLGKHAFEELITTHGHEDGCRKFGYRLGAFVGQLTTVFQPRTIVFSGGLTEVQWPTVSTCMREEIGSSKPEWLAMPDLKRSRHGALAGLQGAAEAAQD